MLIIEIGLDVISERPKLNKITFLKGTFIIMLCAFCSVEIKGNDYVNGINLDGKYRRFLIRIKKLYFLINRRVFAAFLFPHVSLKWPRQFEIKYLHSLSVFRRYRNFTISTVIINIQTNQIQINFSNLHSINYVGWNNKI